MEGQEEIQQPHLTLAHKRFLLTHPDVQDIEKVRLKEEVFAAVEYDSILEKDQSVLDSTRAKNEEELDEKSMTYANRKAALLMFTDFSQVPHDWVMKPSTIPCLPKFHGLASESPFDHLREFSKFCSSWKPQEVNIFRAMFRAFPWSLQGDAKRWFFELSIKPVQTWNDMCREFLTEYFPASKQKGHENLYRYYQRTKEVEAMNLASAKQKASVSSEFSHDWLMKPKTISLLPKFHGLASESPFDYLREFSWVCDSLKPQGMDIHRAMFRAFYLSLQGDAQRWFCHLPMDSIQTWDDAYREFLNKYFPKSKENSLRIKLASVKQREDESLHQYYKRFQRLELLCPTHGVPEKSLIGYFYVDMLWSDRDRVDAANGGRELFDLPPAQARKLIQTVARQEYDAAALESNLLW